MEFQNIEELKDYIHKRAIKRTKIKLRLARHNKLNTSNETLTDLYKASLLEVKQEILEEIKNGTIIVLNTKTKRRTK